MKKTPILNFDRILAGKSGKQLSIILTIFLVILLSVTGFYTYCSKARDNTSFIEFVKDFPANFPKAFVDLTNPETLHKSVYDPDQNTELTNKLPPEWLLFIAYIIGAIVFTGLLIATITNAWRGRAERFRRGAVSYKFKNHIVFLGYNHLIAGMILKILENEKDARIVVGVENNASVISDKIKNRLYDRHRKNVVVLQADSCNREDLDRLRICQAKEVYIIGEHDDTYNLKCYRTIYELSLCERTRETRMPECYVNLHSQTTLTLFRTYTSANELGIDFTNFHSFSFYDEWARIMIMKMLDKKWKIDKNLQNHFIIAGMTEMGIALARKATLLCNKPSDGEHTIITIIDNEMDKKAKHFIVQHQDFFDRCMYRIQSKNFNSIYTPINGDHILDVEYEFIEGNLSDEIIRHHLSAIAGNDKKTTILAICYDDPQQNIVSGLNLPSIYYNVKKKNLDESKARVWIYQPTLGDLGKYLKSYRFNRFDTFGMLGEDLEIQNTECISKAKLITHFFRHKERNDMDYSKHKLIDTEWDATSIAKRWICIRHAEFIRILEQYKANDKDMEIMERKRSAIDIFLFGEEDLYSLEKNFYANYITTLKNIII